MAPQFLGNPYEREDEWGDSDLDLRDEEWLTVPHNVVVLEGRDVQNFFDVDITESDEDILTAESDDWPDNTDDEDYNPDDEDYEETQEIEDLQHYMGDFETSTPRSFFADLYSDHSDDEDEEEFDYVTYPINDNEATSNSTSKTTTSTTTTESNSNNLPTDTDTD